MEIITVSSNVGFFERNLFDLLAAWVTCKGQTCKKSFQKLFENLKYESMNKDFIVERVMVYVSQNDSIFSVSFLQKIIPLMGGMTESCVAVTSQLQSQPPLKKRKTESPKDICRSNHNEQLKEDALKRVQILLTELLSDKTTEEKLVDVNTFLSGSDIRYLPDELKGKLATKLATVLSSKEWEFAERLDWLSVVNLINHYQDVSTADIFYNCSIISTTTSIAEYLKADWTILTDTAIISVFPHYKFGNHVVAVEISMSWCLANRGTCNDATLERIISQICFEMTGDVYNSNILLPTIKHLLPNVTKLECHHSGECESLWLNFKMLPVNDKLYKLEPFEDDVAILTDNNGVLELSWRDTGLGYSHCMFKKDKPHEPFFPVFTVESVDEEALKIFIASLKDGDEIVCI